MSRVTLLLTGVPQYVTLRDLSYNLDRLFNTDEIETFKVRDLPNHPQTNKRQIALDFRSSYDAMAAQEKLEGYTYELDNGREYTLHAKINKSEEYKCNESPEYGGGSRWSGDDWTSLAMIPNVSNDDMYRAHARLDAQLELLKKQKLVLEKEKELLTEKQKLKRKYGSMHTYDAEAEVSSSKRSRSTSRDRSSSYKHPRSRSRETRSRRSRSKDRGYVLPQIEWHDERTKSRELSSHSKERSRSRAYKDESTKSRERRSHSRERSRSRAYNDERTKTKGLSSHSSDRSRSRAYDKRTKTREIRSHSSERSRSRAYSRERRSRGLRSHSRESSKSRANSRKRRSRSRELRSHSRERSRSRAYSRKRRSRSRELRSHSRDRSRSRAYSRKRRSRSRERRSHSRDRSRSRAHSRERRSRSRDLRSHSRDRSRSRAISRERRSRSRELREHRYPDSKKRKPKSKSNEKNRRSSSSRSQDRVVHSREPRSTESRSHSRERMYTRRSRSRKPDRIPYRRSRSRDRARVSTDCDQRGRRLRSPDGRANQLAIIPRSSLRSPSESSVDSPKTVTPPLPSDTKRNTDIKNKQIRTKVEKDAKNAEKSADTKENKTKDRERKKVDKLRKAEKTASRVQALSKDVMILVAILVDEIMDRDKIKISAANKITLIKILEALVQERLEPIASVKKIDDKEVLKRYKKQYPMHGDLKIIKQMLSEITKLEEERKPEATITSSSEINPPLPSEKNKPKHYFVIRPGIPVTGGRLNTDKESKDNVEDIEVLAEDSDRQEPTQQQCTNPIVNLTQAESTGNASKIKAEPKNEPILVIDIDSADKPVPRHPQFVLVIKHLVKNMNKVIRTKKLGGKITFAELKYVLRQILRKMLKGQGFVSREDIIRRFREIHPMENDEQFLRNTIKDIRDGKYPGLIRQVFDVPENESPDDVILIEKKCDVVTLTDSDDDEGEEKPSIDVISLNSNPIYDNLGEAKSNSSTSQAMPGSSNDHVELGASNPGYEGSANSDQDQLKSTNTAEGNADLVKSDQAKTVSDNLAQANIDCTKTSPIVESAEPDQANSCCKIAPRRDMPDLGSPVTVTTSLANPIQGQTSLVNPGESNTGLVKPSQAKKVADPIQGMPEPANCSEVNTGLGNQATTSVANPIQAQTGPVNDSQAIARPAISCQAKKGPNNPGESNTGALLSAHQTKIGRANSGQANISHGNLGQSETCLNASQTTRGHKPDQAKKVPVNISTMSMEEKEMRASLDNTIQNLESQKQQTPDSKNKSNGDSKKKERTNNEESDNNLKVTAITILTSMNELIAKTTEIISPDEIKEEKEVKEEAELDDSSLNLDSAPRVTSITIMTSEAELFSIGNEDPKEVEIKNETDVYYDAEDNLVNDIERALDDVNFGSIQSESIEQNSVNSEQCRVNNTGQISGVNNSGQLGRVNNSGKINETSLHQDSRTVPDDEETIESIVKYVASLY